MEFVHIAGMFGGICLPLFLTPYRVPTALCVFYALLSAGAGVMIAHAGVWFFDRILGVSVVVPLGSGVIGAIIGAFIIPLTIALSLAGPPPPRAINDWFLALPVILGAVIGLSVGITKKAKKTDRPAGTDAPSMP